MSFNPLALPTNGVACPFAKSNPDRYRLLSQCHPEVGFKAVGKLTEHVWRCHSPLQNCRDCKKRWGPDAKKQLPSRRAAHAAECPRNRPVGSSGKPEIMSDQQQEDFQKTKTTNENTTKLMEIYTAVGMGNKIPVTFHVRPLPGDPTPVDSEQQLAVEQQQAVYQQATPEQHHAVEQQQTPPFGPPGRINSGFLNNLVRVVADPTLGPSRTTSLDVLQSNCNTGSSDAVPSGTGNPDSGYVGSEGMVTKGKFAYDEPDGFDGETSSQGLIGQALPELDEGWDEQAGDRYSPELDFDDKTWWWVDGALTR